MAEICARSFEEAAQRLGAAPQHCLIFENVLPAVKSAKQANLPEPTVHASEENKYQSAPRHPSNQAAYHPGQKSRLQTSSKNQAGEELFYCNGTGSRYLRRDCIQGIFVVCFEENFSGKPHSTERKTGIFVSVFLLTAHSLLIFLSPHTLYMPIYFSNSCVFDKSVLQGLCFETDKGKNTFKPHICPPHIKMRLKYQTGNELPCTNTRNLC